jgi:hypothetical protein
MDSIPLGDVVALGAEAWSRLRKHPTWSSWMNVAEALLIGRIEAMRIAGTNRMVGSKYNRAMGAWLQANGFEGISAQERHKAVLCLQNVESIELWRATLDESERRRLNHPAAVLAAWKRATKTTPPRQRANGTKAHDQHPDEDRRTSPGFRKPVFWSQEHIRRAAAAMKERGGGDLYVLAHCALQAAIRDAADLATLMAEERTPPQRPAKPTRRRTKPTIEAPSELAAAP